MPADARMSLEPACAGPECGVRVKEERDGTDGQQEYSVEIKVEWEETDGQQERGMHIKEEPEWTRDLNESLNSDVKEESGLLDLYAGHKVEGDLVLGPEGSQLPDSAFAQPTYASSPRPREGPERPVAPGRGADRDEPRGNGEQKPAQKRPYTCEVCLKEYMYHRNLSRHRRIHTGEKPYSCDICVKKFTQKSNLSQHKRTHTGEKPYSCNVCMKQFKQISHLVVHKRTHTGEKPYSCEVCPKQFTYQSHLSQHRRIHTGEKPYSCDLCTKQFTQKSHLVTHRRTHTKDNL